MNYFQLVGSDQVTVTEGGDVQYVYVQPTFPPAFICQLIVANTDDCTLFVETALQKHDDDFGCYDDGNMVGWQQQAVFGFSADNTADAFCGIALKEDAHRLVVNTIKNKDNIIKLVNYVFC